MDIVRGNLDDISRPPSTSRSCPGSRISSSLQAEKPKTFSTVSSLEVLTPDMCLSEKLTSYDGEESFKDRSPESTLSPNSLSSTEQERVHGNLKSREEAESDSSEQSVDAEHNIDPRLTKAIKRMKVLDEILLKRIAKEKEVVTQSKIMRKQLWEELQSVSKNSSPCSPEESNNTKAFLALTPQFDNTREETSDFEKAFPVFSTEVLLENFDADEPKAVQGKTSRMETSDVLNSSQRTSQKKYKDNIRGVDFIQRNIELVKEAGSHVLFMDDEKLRLEQLLADIQDGCSDDDVTTDSCFWLVPGEGFSPESEELTQLARIDEQLQMFCSTTETRLTGDTDHGVSPKQTKLDLSLDKFGNSLLAPGERVLRYTKEIREQKIRLREIDQQLENMERSSTSPASESCFTPTWSESSINIE